MMIIIKEKGERKSNVKKAKLSKTDDGLVRT